jgi:hypothetical protein
MALDAWPSVSTGEFSDVARNQLDEAQSMRLFMTLVCA